ncbi:MAG: 15-cis-phytoene synthase [Gemmobacter sp.]
MSAAADLEACRAAIRTGSHSFHAASRLLPPRVREPALALYAFCRVADDAVDAVPDADAARKAAAVIRLGERLEAVYAGRPRDAAADRAFARVVEDFGMPRALPEALLEGFAWDAEGRRPQTLADLRAYAARVAASVGAMMCVLMRVRERDALARACDLGLAMQLTNIARDVGEDARAGRLYLPGDWLAEAGVDAAAFLARPEAGPAVRAVVRRVLAEAEALYLRAEAGAAALPMACRPGIFAAARIYRGIGGAVARAGYDSVSMRARTGRGQKIGWLVEAAARAAVSAVMPRPAWLHARPVPETAFLVEAAAAPGGRARSEAMLAVLAQLAARDRERRSGLDRLRA